MYRFDTWAQVLAHVRAGKAVFYQAPLDARPARVEASARPKGRTVRVRPFGYWPRGQRPFDPFTADRGHLDRFRQETVLWRNVTNPYQMKLSAAGYREKTFARKLVADGLCPVGGRELMRTAIYDARLDEIVFATGAATYRWKVDRP